jgi:hypothetical protein
MPAVRAEAAMALELAIGRTAARSLVEEEASER